MEVAGLFSGGIGILIFRHTYLYIFPGFVSMVALVVFAQSVVIDEMIAQLFPDSFSETTFLVAAIVITAYVLGNLIDHLVRRYLRRGIAYNEQVKRVFQKEVNLALSKPRSSLAKVLKEVIPAEDLTAIVNGEDVADSRFPGLLNQTMNQLDIKCAEKDQALFAEISMPSQLASGFAANMALALQALAVGVGISVPRVVISEICSCGPGLGQTLAMLVLLAISLGLIYSAFALRRRSESFWTLRIQQSFAFLRAG